MEGWGRACRASGSEFRLKLGVSAWLLALGLGFRGSGPPNLSPSGPASPDLQATT